MSKKIIKITKEGVRESISGNSQALPSSVEFQLSEATLIQSTQFIDTATTGSADKAVLFTAPGSLVVLPSSPVVGQRFEVINPTSDVDPIGISGSHSLNEGEDGVDVSGSFGKADLTFVGAVGWHVSLNGFTSGTYTF